MENIHAKYYRLNDRTQRVDLLTHKVWQRMDGKSYQVDVLASQIASTRNTEEYHEHQDLQCELTMSCSILEATDWMTNWMMEALANGMGQKDIHLRAKFLAAYDTRRELVNSASASGHIPSNAPWWVKAPA